MPTLRGPIAADELGTTLIHEHVFVRDHELERNVAGLGWDRRAMVERAVVALTELYELGVGTVVDLTVIGLGRDVSLVREVAERIPLNLVAATGLYPGAGLPLHFELRGPGRLVDVPEPLVDLFVGDIEQGIGGTDVRAAVIKVGSVSAGPGEAERRVLAAAAKAHERTGVAIMTHSVAAQRNGPAQQDLLLAQGVAADRIVIGHCGDTDDIGYLQAIMDKGSTIGLDRFGMRYVLDDETRMATVAALVAAGYADRMVLSHDAAIYSHATPPAWRAEHAPGWGMDHLPRRILPTLRQRGVSEADLERMLVSNPARLLSGGHSR